MANLQKLARMSQLFQPINILPKESSKQEPLSKSYKHLLQNGLIRQVNTGMYAFLPLGLRVLNKITALVDTEMAKIGAQKVLLPALTNSNLWKITDRYKAAKPELFILQDRHGKEFLLSPTYEEVVTKLLSEFGLLSPTMFPLKFYQISSKWRDEMKSRIGFLRSREFIMKDLYTFDTTADTAKQTYNVVCETYDNLFKQIGINFVKVVGEVDNIGGDMTHEYHYFCNIGEDTIHSCLSCNYHTKSVFNETNCPHCQRALTQQKSSEVGHTFFLNRKYSQILSAVYNTDNKPSPLVMGCYGLGISRIITAAVEILSSDTEMRWPKILAPYTVCIIPPKEGSKEESAIKYIEHIFNALHPLNVDMILDDRTKLTIGKRCLQAKQVGYPYVIVIGKKAMESNPLLEVYDVNNSTSSNIPINELTNYFSFASDKEGVKRAQSL